MLRKHHSTRILLAAMCMFGGLRGTANAVSPQEKTAMPSATELLREASRIAAKQSKDEKFWTKRILLSISAVQRRSGDLDGARISIRESDYEGGRFQEVLELAKAMAAVGRKEKAFDLLHEMETDHFSLHDWAHDEMRVRWIEYLMSTGKRDQAVAVADEVAVAALRPAAFRTLALGYARAGDGANADRFFHRAVEASAALSEEYYQCKSLWEIADAQVLAGKAEAAAATVRELVKVADKCKEPWAKTAAFREAATRVARANDRPTADRLFSEAIDAAVPSKAENDRVRLANWTGALNLLAKAQASVGYTDEALHTARMIEHSETNNGPDGDREQAIYKIAVAQARAGSLRDAMATALSIKYYPQYKDDALFDISDFQLATGASIPALDTAKKIENPSRRAIAMLKIATKYAKGGNKGGAQVVFAEIQLASDHFSDPTSLHTYDFAKPETWAFTYQGGFTMASWAYADHLAAEVAAASMTLQQTLHDRPGLQYSIAFKGVDGIGRGIIRAIARAHAATGDPREALAWARQIGSDGKIASENDDETRCAVERRIGALIGVAEGMLDRQPEHPPIESER